MARTGVRREADARLPTLLEALAREWSRRAAPRLPAEFTAHLRAAVRELVLAGAALGESVLRSAGARAAEARRRAERIPVSPRRASRRRPARPRRT